MSKTSSATPPAGTDRETHTVHTWRVGRLTGLGVTEAIAEAVADQLDWHEVARLVERGCPAALAVSIVD